MAAGPAKQRLVDLWELTPEDWPGRMALTERLLQEKIWPSPEVEKWEEGIGTYPDIEDPDFLSKLLRKKQFDDLRQPSFAQGLSEFVKGERTEKKVPAALLGRPPQSGEIGRYLESEVQDKCRSTEDFELSSTQKFASRFLNPRTPYRGALFYHGVGVGKTCAAVTVCENYLEMYPGREVFIVAPAVIQAGFRRTIFSSDKDDLILGTEGGSNHHRGCTGDLYLHLTDTLKSPNRSLIENRVTKLINKRYKFFGYTSFANYIEDLMKTVSKIENESVRHDRMLDILHHEFNNRLIIIDEAHNLRDNPAETSDEGADDASVAVKSDAAAGKKLTPFLRDMLRYTHGVTLLLMTATPMYNSYTEILFLLNLLLLNDKFPELRTDDIFDKTTNTIRKSGRKILGSIVGTYVSFMRGEDPLSFPVRLYPLEDRISGAEYPSLSPLLQEFEDEDGNPVLEDGEPDPIGATKAEMEELPLVACEFDRATESAYYDYSLEIAQRGGLNITNLNDLVQAGNWIFPGESEEVIDRMGQKGFDAVFEKELRGTNAVFQCTWEEGTSWLEEANVSKASAKCAKLLERLRNGKGVSFVYSRFVAAGALAIAMCLEVNGYTLYGRDYGFLVKTKKPAQGRQCALCPNREVGHPADHSFVPAKFILLTGSEELSGDNRKSIDAARSRKNKDGRDIKVVLGSQIAGEGLDLRFIREVFVFDSWFHLNKLEQIVGRGVRKCSHADLPREDQNCTVTYLVNRYAGDEPVLEGIPRYQVETVDTYSYRTALRKAKLMGQVTRLLKEYAMDCSLNYDAIMIDFPKKIPAMKDSQGNDRDDIEIRDKPSSAQCDYLSTCTYECLYSPDRKFPKNPAGSLKTYSSPGPVDTSSLDEYSSRFILKDLRSAIEDRFMDGEGEAYGSVEIDKLLTPLVGVPRPLLRSLLTEMIEQKDYRIKIKGIPGRLLLRNEFIVFQPDYLEKDDVPIALRVSGIPIPRDTYGFYQPKEEEAIRLDVKVDSNEFDSSDLWTAAQAFAIDLEEGTVRELDQDLLDHVNLLPSSKGIAVSQKMRLEMILWVYDTIKENDEIRSVLAKAVKQFFWDEFITSGTKRQTLLDTPAPVVESELVKDIAPDVVMTIPGYGTYLRYLRNQRTQEEIKAIAEREKEKKKKSAGETVYDLIQCLFVGPDKKARPSGVAQTEKVLQETGTGVDPLTKPPLTDAVAGYEYGFLQYNKGSNSFVFKKGKPPKAGAKIGPGAQCSNNSSVRYELDLLLKLGKTLREWSAETYGEDGVFDFGLNAEEFGNRKITNSIRICTLVNIVLRCMDVLKVNGKRWFYRPLEAVVTKHPIK